MTIQRGTHIPANQSDLNPNGVGLQQIRLYNQFSVQGDSQNYWWISFSHADGHRGCLLTQDKEQGDLFKMMDRITAAGLNPGGDDVAVFCVTAQQLMQSGDGWMLEKCDILQSHKTMVDKGSPSIFL